MRPDEHKKKKNAVYKKKHGIKDKDNEQEKSKTNKKKDEKNKTTSTRFSENNEPTTSSLSTTSGRSAVSQDNSSSSESENEQFVNKKSYKRREIVSNWKKYECEGDLDSPIKARGEDYNKLLNMGGEAMSRFRFQDELEWEEDIDSGKGDEKMEKEFLSLDLTDIASSMACIPIHQILGIDQSLFPENQLRSNIKLCSENHASYIESINDRLQPKIETEKSKLKNSKRSNDPSPTEIKSSTPQHQSVHSELEKLETNPHKLDKSPEIDVKNDPTKAYVDKDDNKRLSALKDSSVQSENKTSLSLKDDLLDELLDIDVRKQPSGDGAKNTAIATHKKDETKEADELEDWLDSILD